MKKELAGFVYKGLVGALYPLNYLLSIVKKKQTHKKSVLFIDYPVHVTSLAVNIARKEGYTAGYLAVGTSDVWSGSDYRYIRSRWPFITPFQEFYIFWKVIANYEILHLQRATCLSETGWELPFFKKMGRAIVIHYRGCEARNRTKNMLLHPDLNICQDCDYGGDRGLGDCQNPSIHRRKEMAEKYADAILVTTPDMKDFYPEAIFFPLFAPESEDTITRTGNVPPHPFRIVHATNHPGIEGSARIEKIIRSLQQKGYSITFQFLKGVSNSAVLEELRIADLSIGKMKMGYYANFQIESMYLGVPAVAYVREEFITKELQQSGLIITSLPELEETLQFYLDHPEKLQEKKEIARNSAVRLHCNERLGKELIGIYESVKSR